MENARRCVSVCVCVCSFSGNFDNLYIVSVSNLCGIHKRIQANVNNVLVPMHHICRLKVLQMDDFAVNTRPFTIFCTIPMNERARLYTFTFEAFSDFSFFSIFLQKQKQGKKWKWKTSDVVESCK